jgi:DNA repair exonuclease SbcCD nuclease subunit
MKLALVTDLHFGVRNDNASFADFFERFYSEIFFPYLKEHSIDTIVDLGDTFDRRKYVNFVSLDRAKKMFFDPIDKNNYKLHALVGNHDSFYKNTIEINSMELLASHYETMRIYSKAGIQDFDGLEILMLPWICSENEEEIFDLCKSTSAQVLFGHLELSGYQMHKGQSINHGMKDDWLQKFDVVCTGHYHTKSTTGNINYLGCPYEMTWADHGDQKGFHVFDTETRELEFIPNPFTMFHKIHYNDRDKSMEQVTNIEFEKYNKCFVKIIVSEKTNPFWFDMFVDKLEKAGPIHVQVVEDHLHLDMESDDDIVSEAEDTMTILHNYIEALDINVDKNKLEYTIKNLYSDALSIS